MRLTLPLVAGTLALVLAGVAIGSGWPGLTAGLLIGAAWLGHRRPLRPTRRQAGARSGEDGELNGDAWASVAPASASRAPLHPVSGLDTREPLLARMADEGAGTLGVVAFKDYDRLCAFDPEAGDRVLRTLANRVRAMLPPTRMIAHVDRGQVAIWIDAGTHPDEAERELAACIYALGDAVRDGAGDILPEVALRHVHCDGTEPPDVALARTIASFAVADLGEGAGAQDVQLLLARDRFQLEQDLRQAIARNELQLVFQPLVDAGKGRVAGAEALLRWQRQTGPVSPARFVPVMEAAGLSGEIGLWALNAALREVAEWARRGQPGMRIAVNVSGQQLAEAELPKVVARMLTRHALPASALEVELTESVALNDAGQAAQLVQALRAQGVAVAIDDFGTGFSSLSTMRRLRFDKIKIDREFVTDVHRRPESQAICQSIIALGRGLGLRVLAEGVEQADEVQWLRRHGCTHFQGFYFSPPLASAEFLRFADDRPRLARLLAHDPAALQQQIKRTLSA